ncbi:ABC transporter substrate-binding protein [Marisediminicola sp. LYQ134]|uniref:ABC transporter substrate-binding protein n=1 Tax=Marisediminicola sp. LYQ134 TaxID=3391061 RepID=UPI003983A0D5
MAQGPLCALATSAVAAALAVSLVACASSGTTDSMPVPSASATPSPSEVAPSGDGELSIGTLFELTGDLADIGAAQVAGVDAAVRALNEAGGVGGTPAVVTHRDASGDGLVSAARELADLGVDVIIGPGTADAVARVAEALADDDVAVVSPTAGPLAVDEPLALVLAGLDDDAHDSTAHDSTAPDSMRDPTTADDDFTALVRTTDPGVADVAYAAEAFDAATLVALAAIAVADDGGPSIAAAVASVTTGSVSCSVVGECIAALDDGVTIAFTGMSGARSFR